MSTLDKTNLPQIVSIHYPQKPMLTHTTFVASLADTNDLKEHDTFIKACIKRGDVSTLRDLFNAILERYTLSLDEWAPRTACERILEALALT
ncbi:MAG: hypothetical protein MUD01_26570, partial [Chloroflexaceae bacterium]|nr:hypothetical protein [Chloroflexaceae bacterium]